METVRDFDDTRVIRQAFAILAGDRPTGPTRDQELDDMFASWSSRPSNAD